MIDALDPLSCWHFTLIIEYIVKPLFPHFFDLRLEFFHIRLRILALSAGQVHVPSDNIDTSQSHQFVEEWWEIFIIGGDLQMTVDSAVLHDCVKDLRRIIFPVGAVEQRK
jgi:hypothetical protein